MSIDAKPQHLFATMLASVQAATAAVAACTEASIVANKCWGLASLDMTAAANAIPIASQNQHQRDSGTLI